MVKTVRWLNVLLAYLLASALVHQTWVQLHLLGKSELTRALVSILLYATIWAFGATVIKILWQTLTKIAPKVTVFFKEIANLKKGVYMHLCMMALMLANASVYWNAFCNDFGFFVQVVCIISLALGVFYIDTDHPLNWGRHFAFAEAGFVAWIATVLACGAVLHPSMLRDLLFATYKLTGIYAILLSVARTAIWGGLMLGVFFMWQTEMKEKNT